MNWETPEAWLPIPGYAGYEASSLGRVRSVDRMVNTAGSERAAPYTRICKGRTLRPAPCQSGHLMVMAGRNRHLMVHVAVALAFHGSRPFPRAEILHRDGVATNNTPLNLHWGTRSENLKDDTRHGKRQLTLNDADKIRSLRLEGWTLPALSRKFGINTGQVWHICRGNQYAR
jgi:hypothetical protein